VTKSFFPEVSYKTRRRQPAGFSLRSVAADFSRVGQHDRFNISGKEFPMSGSLVTLSVLAVLFVLVLPASIALPADKATTRPTPREPDPALAPEQVIRAVLDALKHNDEHDDGIRTTFKFASPANQAVTGPVERFIPMVKSPAYRALVNHKGAKVGKVERKDDQAAALVLVIDSNGDGAYYVWHLSRQKDGAHKDCWMTDGVAPVQPPADDDDFQKA